LLRLSSPTEGRTYRISIPQNLPRIKERPRDLGNELISKLDSGVTIDPLPCNMQLNSLTGSSGEVLESHDLAGAAD